MATSPKSVDSIPRRMALVEEHVRCENAHDLDGVIRTFGDTARYDDEPWDQHFEGLEQVRGFYSQLMQALPDLSIDVVRRHVAEETIVLEVMIRGTHSASWKGLPPTGRKVAVPLCGIYTFTVDDRLAGERIYYDRATVLRQLGVFHEPQSLLGRITAVLTHPVSITKALVKAVTSG